MSRTVAIFLVCLVLLVSGLPARAGQGVALQADYRGIRLMAMAPDPARTFDTALLPPRDAMEKLKSSLDTIREKSPIHAKAIEEMKPLGRIYLVYNPNYPGQHQDLARIRVALFLPFYLSSASTEGPRPLPVVVSRHGIKWPVKELSAVIVHELAGHGRQYLNGQTRTLRVNELECQAWLHQELAHQAFGMDKSDPKMIRFRQQLGGTVSRAGHCTPFLNDLRKNDPEKVSLYDRLNPDVPALLLLLDRYIEVLEASGITQKALDARQAYLEERLGQVERDGSSKQLFGTGIYLLEGAGYHQDIRRGAGFIRLSALKNHAPAQYHLALLHARGRGVEKSPEKAYFWLRVAARSAAPGLQKKISQKTRDLSATLTAARLKFLDEKAGLWDPSAPLILF